MEYFNIINPLMCISLSVLLGMMLGSLYTFYVLSSDIKSMIKEIDAKNKELKKYKSK